MVGRLMSGQVGSSRYKSGQSGRYFFSGNCYRYAFASVFPFPESIPGSGNLSPTLTDAGLKPVSWRLGGRVSSLDA